MAGGDRAGAEFWELWWERTGLPAAIDPHRRGLKNYPFRKFHEYFARVFQGSTTQGTKLIEIGAAQSAFLPYFAKYFEFEVYGLDRSKRGCERAEAVLRREKIEGHIYCGDLFSPPEQLRGVFDVVFSNGVVEHFEDTVECLRMMAALLKPQGKLVTVIPNMVGINGKLQKIMDRAI